MFIRTTVLLLNDVTFLNFFEMGFVTVLVQHSWSMQPSKSCRKPAKTSIGSRPNKKNQPVRLTDIKSVIRFTDQFNRSDSANRRFLESEARDILDRLARLSLQSSILDPVRIDPIRQSLKAVRKPVTPDSVGQDKTRFYAAQARISLVAFGTSQALHLRDKALDILIEALDTNLLSYDASESKCLFDLIIHLKKAVQIAVDNTRTENPTEMRVNADSHMERLLKVH